MLSVVTLLLAAFVMSTPASRDGVERGPSLPAPSFCAELEAPPVLMISSADEEDLMPFEEGQSCAESDVLQPFDIEAPVDTV